MRLLESEGLVVDLVNLGERDRIVTLLSPEHGKVRGVAKGARGKFSRYSGHLHLLAKVRFGWFEKDGASLARLRDVQMLRPADTLQADLEGILLGTYLAEHAATFAQENERSERLFRLVDTSVAALMDPAVPNELVARYFECWMLRLAGVFPHPAECPVCGSRLTDLAVLPEGLEGLVCGSCAPGHSGFRIGPEVLGFLLQIGSLRVQEVAARRPSRGVLERVEELCVRVRREFLGDELRSYLVMKRTLLEVGSVSSGGP